MWLGLRWAKPACAVASSSVPHSSGVSKSVESICEVVNPTDSRPVPIELGFVRLIVELVPDLVRRQKLPVTKDFFGEQFLR